MSRSVDLFVIGGGSGGVRAGRIAAQHGAKVMLAEEFRLGGTCVIRGCVPKKLFVYAGRYGHDLQDMAGYGWTVEGARFDWPTLIANKDREITRLEGIYQRNLETPGVEILRDRAEVIGPNTVRIVGTGEIIEARYILVATGGHPALGPAIPGAELAITSNEAFNLPALPKRVLVQGGGYIAVEFACLFQALGCEVTLVLRAEQILRSFDDDVRNLVAEEMKHTGINILTGRSLASLTQTADGKRVELSDGSHVDVDAVLLALGRLPNTKGLGLEAAGVTLDSVGAIPVDADGRTNVPSIYAVGDVTNRVNLTPVAIREGHAFADSVFGGKPWRVDHHLVATAVFTEPEVGTVGLSEAAAREAGFKLDIYKAQFRPMRATLSGRATRMLVKLVVDAETDKVLGCHVVGEAASEIIQMAAVAIGMGATKADFDRTVAVHPTAAEELVTMRTKSA